MIKAVLVFFGCAVMIGGSAYRNGRFSSDDSSAAMALSFAAERVAGLPHSFGEWSGEDFPVTDVDAMRRGGAVEFMSRVYRRRKNEEPMSVLLVCGKPGPLSVHTPDVCYAGASFAPDPNQQRLSLTERDEFTWQSFTSSVDGRPDLEIAWSWTVDGRWSCPVSPRIKFGREPFLYKVYVARRLRGKRQPSPEIQSFLRSLVSSAQGSIFMPPPGGADLTATFETFHGRSGFNGKPLHYPELSNHRS